MAEAPRAIAPVWDVLYPEEQRRIVRLLVEDISSYSMEKRYIRKGGGTVWANLTASLVRKADGEPRWFSITTANRMGYERPACW